MARERRLHIIHLFIFGSRRKSFQMVFNQGQKRVRPITLERWIDYGLINNDLLIHYIYIKIYKIQSGESVKRQGRESPQ